MTINVENITNKWMCYDLYESIVSKVLNETHTPHDRKSLDDSFLKDVSDDKMSPTQNFLTECYGMFNGELFGDQLPKNLLFIVKSLPRSSFLGLASCRLNRYENTITPISITLNSAKMLTLHEWMGVVLHEMVHVCDYVNYPEHFIGYMARSYDVHGRWFLSYGEQFKQYGYNIEKYFEGNIGLNTDDRRVKNIIEGSVFMLLDDFKISRGKAIVRISTKNVDKFIDMISEGLVRGRYKGLTSITMMKSENPSVVNLKELRMRDSHSTLNYYIFDDNFEKKYGPFEKIKTIQLDVMRTVREDKDETEYEDMNRIDDAHVRKMYDNITNVVDIEKVDDGVFDVSIT